MTLPPLPVNLLIFDSYSAVGDKMVFVMLWIAAPTECGKDWPQMGTERMALRALKPYNSVKKFSQIYRYRHIWMFEGFFKNSYEKNQNWHIHPSPDNAIIHIAWHCVSYGIMCLFMLWQYETSISTLQHSKSEGKSGGKPIFLYAVKENLLLLRQFWAEVKGPCPLLKHIRHAPEVSFDWLWDRFKRITVSDFPSFCGLVECP